MLVKPLDAAARAKTRRSSASISCASPSNSLAQIRAAPQGARRRRRVHPRAGKHDRRAAHRNSSIGSRAKRLRLPHTLIVLGENAKGDRDRPFQIRRRRPRALACGINDFHLAPAAAYLRRRAGMEPRQPRVPHLNSTIVDRSANSTALAINLGRGLHARRKPQPPRRRGRPQRDAFPSTQWMAPARWTSARCRTTPLPARSATCSTTTRSTTPRARFFAGLIKVEPGRIAPTPYQKVRQPHAQRQRRGEGHLDARPRDSRRRRPLHARRDDESHRRGRALLHAGPRISEKAGRRLVVAGFFHARSSSAWKTSPWPSSSARSWTPARRVVAVIGHSSLVIGKRRATQPMTTDY